MSIDDLGDSEVLSEEEQRRLNTTAIAKLAEKALQGRTRAAFGDDNSVLRISRVDSPRQLGAEKNSQAAHWEYPIFQLAVTKRQLTDMTSLVETPQQNLPRFLVGAHNEIWVLYNFHFVSPQGDGITSFETESMHTTEEDVQQTWERVTRRPFSLSKPRFF